MVDSEVSAVEIDIQNYMEYLRRKAIVTLPDLDNIYILLGKMELKIEELRKSRDNWRNKYTKISLSTKVHKDVKETTKKLRELK